MSDVSETPEPVKKCPKSAAYRSVSLYDSSLKKAKCVKVKRADFTSPEELDRYVKKLQEDQKIKNAQFRADVKRTKINAVLDGKVAAITLKPMTRPMPEVTGMPNIQLDPGTGSTILLLGSSKRGKSTLMMKLYEKYYQNKNNIVTLLSDNSQLDIYRKRGDGSKDADLLIGYGFGPSHARYIEMQHYINVKTKNKYKFVVMMDDIISEKHTKVVSKMILTYRNSNISMMLAVQSLFLVSKSNRGNINHTFVFGMNAAEQAVDICKMVLRPYFNEMGVTSLNDQVALYNKLTEDHGYIYIDNVKGKISFHR